MRAEELEKANLESSFEDMMSEVHPGETKVGFFTFNTSDLIKKYDPIAWKMAFDEFIFINGSTSCTGYLIILRSNKKKS